MKLAGLLSMMLALGASAPSASGSESEVKPRLNGEIRGYVIALDTGMAIVPVTVRLKGTDLDTFTRPDGAFRVENVPPGTYTLEILASAAPYQMVEVRGVVVRWTEVTNIPLPFGLPKFDARRRDPLIIDLAAIETIAQLLEGTLPPRLPAEPRVGHIVCEIWVENFSKHVAGRGFQYPWQHRLPMTWDALREELLYNTHSDRAFATWTETRRNRLE